jgi:hypothetical protein
MIPLCYFLLLTPSFPFLNFLLFILRTVYLSVRSTARMDTVEERKGTDVCTYKHINREIIYILLLVLILAKFKKGYWTHEVLTFWFLGCDITILVVEALKA